MLDPKHVAHSIMSKLHPSAHPQGFAEGGEVHDEKSVIASDLIEGIHEKDHEKVVAALEALCDYIKAEDLKQDEGEMQEGPEEQE